MDCGGKFLSYSVPEKGADKPEAPFEISYGVTVRKQETSAKDLLYQSAVDNLYSYLIPQIIEQPDIVVAGKPYNPDSAVRHPGKLTEEPQKAPRRHILIFEPEIENVAEQIQLGAVMFDRPQKAHNLLLMLTVVSDI